MAALLESQTGLSSTLIEGRRGEFSIWVGDQCVAKKDVTGFPGDDEIVKAVKELIAGRAR